MSPYMFATFEDSMVDYQVTLSKYDITKNGFLPADEPLSSLSDSYYTPWEVIASRLASLVSTGRIRTEVQALPILSTTRLWEKREWRRAYVVLAFIAHAYIWGGDGPAEILPPAVSSPFLEVSKHLELPPVATYASLCLWNYHSSRDCIIGVDFRDSESLTMMISLTGTTDEAWFYLISVMVEAQGGSIIPRMLETVRAVKEGDYSFVIKALQSLELSIRDLARLLERMYEHCQPNVFYHQIRPMLAGSKNMASAGLPNGVFYDEGKGQGQWVKLRGGSNAQSSLIQFFDAVLGIVHHSTGEKGTHFDTPASKEMSFHKEMRMYMPGPHRRFLEDVTRIANIRDFAMATTSHPQQRVVLEAYQNCVQALSDFRGLHLQIVARYIIIPSRQASTFGKMNLAVASSDSTDGELTGTGGTDLVPFLKQTREETELAGRIE